MTYGFLWTDISQWTDIFVWIEAVTKPLLWG
jgi:hypothetical protein